MFKAKLQTIYSKLFKTAYYPTNKIHPQTPGYQHIKLNCIFKFLTRDKQIVRKILDISILRTIAIYTIYANLSNIYDAISGDNLDILPFIRPFFM